MTIEPNERLFVPHRKRLSYSYAVNDDGVRELRIDYGLKEITFDEEHLFAFGERLTREPSFTGTTATTWGPGYRWSELKPLLEALIGEGILKRGEGDGLNDPRGGGLVPSQVPAAVCSVPRFWSVAECEAIMNDLGNRPIEIGYLEAVVPMFRICHPALDADNRQVGEANVFPDRLRLERDTEWRVCQYSGSRYRDDTPMNVTALKAMIKHWKPMLAAILAVRDEVRERLGGSGARPWEIGELHLLAWTILGLPTFQLMQRGGSSPQVPLHPVLSSLFRITDGIRMSTFDMVFSIEHTRRSDEPMTAAQLHEYAEQHTTFIGQTGVCAGPRPLIDEFLVAVVDGIPAEGLEAVELPAEVRDLLSQLPAAVDYGLLAMQSWAASSSVWLAMARAYHSLLAVVEDAIAAGAPGLVRLVTRLRADRARLDHAQITLDYDAEVHLKAYRDGYERAWRAGRTHVGPAKLDDAIAPVPETAMHLAAADQLRAGLAAYPPLARAGLVEPVVDTLVDYLRHEQAAVASVLKIQAAINQLLDRPRPRRPLCARDFHASYVIAGDRFPYLLDSIEAELGVRVDCTTQAIAISDRRAE